MSRRTQLKKPGLYLLQKQIRSFRKDGVAKAAGIWRKIRTQTEPLDLAIGQGDLDMGSRGGGGYQLKGAGRGDNGSLKRLC